MLLFHFSLQIIKDHCLNLIVREENFSEIVMSEDFVALDKPLMVEIIRKRVYPGRVNDMRVSTLSGNGFHKVFKKLWGELKDLLCFVLFRNVFRGRYGNIPSKRRKRFL